jgi:hypothetical protein
MHKDLIKQYQRFGSFLMIGLLISAACSTKKVARTPVLGDKYREKETFIIKPFGYEPTIKNFKEYLPSSFKLQVYTMKNIHRPSIIDTIYNFHHKKSKLLIYKNVNNREIFFAGNIYTDKIQLSNGVKVGMKRNDFFRCFSNLPHSEKDTIRISSKRATNSVNFIFQKNELTAIKLDNYID